MPGVLKRRRQLPNSLSLLLLLTCRESDHFVQFYEDEAFLENSVAEFIGAGIGAGDAGILIATPAHRESIERRLTSQGIDLETVKGRQQFVSLDSAETLAQFMVEGCPDPRLFEQTMDRYIPAARHGRNRLRAFGEMVALLWADGNSAGAIRLEELWNQLGQKHSFALFCAYPLRGFHGTENGESFQHVCSAHTRVLPSESYAACARNPENGLREVARLQQRAASLEAEIAARKQVEMELRQARAELEAQLGDLRQLHEYGGRLSSTMQLEETLREILRGALAIHNTNMGLLSIATADHQGLRVGASFGFSNEFLNRVQFIPTGVGACGNCLAQKQRVVVTDTETEPLFESLREAARLGQFRAVHSTPLLTRGGKCLGVLSVHFTGPRTVSERERQLMDIFCRRASDLIENAFLREEARRANEELEQRVRERTASLREMIEQMEEFSYTVSHDLRAPLRAMQVYSEALLDDLGASISKESVHYLQRIRHNSQRLDAMVRDVLTFSRLARAEFKMNVVSLDKLVRDIVQHYPGLQPPQTEITVETLEDVIGHEPSLMQAVSNLLGNAVKFMGPGVRPKIRIWTEREGDQIRVNVQDNGIGVPVASQARLFKMFERLHPELPHEGTGVGLAIVRKATERMGGKVGVISDGAHGSIFWMLLRRPE